MSCVGCGKSNNTYSQPSSAKIKGCCEEEKKPFTKYSLLNAGASVIRHYMTPKYNAFSPDDVKEARLKACEKCEYLTTFLKKKQCQICKCFVEPKAALIDQKCPYPEQSKW